MRIKKVKIFRLAFWIEMAAQDTSAKANNDYLNQLLKEQESLNSQCTNAHKLLQQGKIRGHIMYCVLLILKVHA